MSKPLSLSHLRKELRIFSNPKKAAFYPYFFKTGKGEYGEGDIFMGVSTPHQRLIVKKFVDLSFEDILKLLHSKIHEERSVAILILVSKFEHGGTTMKKKVYAFYIKNRDRVNNWDLVDTSAHLIVGAHLHDKKRDKIYSLAQSKVLWDKRIAIISTFYYIKRGEYKDTLEIAKILLNDPHDLLHKAVGWMLREVGNRDLAVEEQFLKKHYKKMPRTMLRYAIEKFPEVKRKKYLQGKI